MAIYLIKINLAVMLLYGFYRLLVSRDTFFTLRRSTLLVIYGVSVLLPLLDMAYWLKDEPLTATMAVSYADNVLPALMVYADAPSVTVQDAMVGLYVAVVALLVVRLLWQLLVIARMAHAAEVVEMAGLKVRCLKGKENPFSFFRWVFLNPEGQTPAQLQEILIHEYTHVSQWHSVDTLLAELFCIVCWFNPFAWLMKREVRINLEYLADEKVLAEGNARKSYQYHLLGLAYHPTHLDAANNFNVLQLKKRIKMMNKRRTKEIGKMKYLLLAPLTAMLLLVSNVETVARTLTQKLPAVDELATKANALLATDMLAKPAVESAQATAVEEMAEPVKKITVRGTIRDEKGEPIIGATVQVKGAGKGVVTDREGYYELPNVSEKQIIQVSYVGLESATFKAKKERCDAVLRLPRPDEDNKTYSVVETMPEFPGGSEAMLKYIGQHVKYPDDKVKTFVVVQFVVGKDGTISSPKVLRSGGEAFDKAAIDVVMGMPKWNPGMQNGKPVAVKYTMPIRFGGQAKDVQPAKKEHPGMVLFVDGKRVDNIDNIKPEDIAGVELLKDEASRKKYETGEKTVVLVTLKKK